jgi:hypothetical protein
MVIYPNLASAMRPIPHNDGMSVPKPPNNVTIDEDNPDADEVHPDKVGERIDSDPTFEQ